MTRSRYFGRGVLLVLGIGVLAFAARTLTVVAQDPAVSGAASPDDEAVQRDVNERADELLRMMSATLAAAERLRFTASGLENITDEGTGRTVHYLTSRIVSVTRPNRLRVEEADSFSKHGAWFDDGRLTIFDSLSNQYATIDAPGTIDALLDHLSEQYQLVMPSADFLYRDPYAALSAEIEVGDYLGETIVDGHRCHHLAFRQEVVDWQLWLDVKEGATLPRKFVIAYKNEYGHPQFTMTFTDWDLDPDFAEDYFEASIPPDAEHVDIADLRKSGTARDRVEKGAGQ